MTVGWLSSSYSGTGDGITLAGLVAFSGVLPASVFPTGASNVPAVVVERSVRPTTTGGGSAVFASGGGVSLGGGGSARRNAIRRAGGRLTTTGSGLGGAAGEGRGGGRWTSISTSSVAFLRGAGGTGVTVNHTSTPTWTASETPRNVQRSPARRDGPGARRTASLTAAGTPPVRPSGC